MISAFLVFTTAPSRMVARKLTKTLLGKRLAACIHLMPPGESHYWWRGKIEKAREVTMILKTSKKALPLLLRTLKKIHPYETPEILAVCTDHADPAYLKWIQQETHC